MSTRSELEEILYVCARGFDSNDIELLADCYTKDAAQIAQSGTVEGREAIRERSLGIRARFAEGGGQPRHLITNVQVEGESPTEARSRASFSFSLANEGSVSILSTGCYVDSWVKDGDRWRIKQRVIENDSAPRASG